MIALGLLMAMACGGGSTGTPSSAGMKAPAISTQPQDASVTVGATATFQVTASGTAPLHYQWRKGGADIAGAVTSSYTTSVTVLADDGATFSVTVTNAAGHVDSRAAVLTVRSTPTPGAGWKPLRVGAGGFLTGLDIAPDGTKVVRADTYGAYLWSDSGWKQLVTISAMPTADAGVARQAGVYEIRIAPSLTTRFYMMFNRAIYRSDNRGTTWARTAFQPVTSGCDANDNYRVHGPKMAIDPVNPDVVYAGTTNDGLWVTTDGGAHWNQVTAVAKGVADQGGVTGLAFDASSGQIDGRTKTLYAASWGGGVYRSTDGGTSWTLTSGGPTTVHHGVVSAEGIYYAVDGAAAWKYSASVWTSLDTTQDWHSLAADPADSRRLVLCNSGGTLNQSLDGGTTWTGAIWGTTAHPIAHVAADVPWLAWTNESYMSNGEMAFDPSASNKLYVSEGIGVWYASSFTRAQTWDTGPTWNSQSQGIEQLVASQIVVPPGGKPIVLSWDRPVFRLEDPDVYPSAHGPDREFAIVAGWDGDYALDDHQYIVALMDWWGREKSGYSTDGGRTWTSFAAHPDGANIGGSIAVSNAGNIVWIPEDNSIPYYTKDNGQTWTPAVLPDAPTSGETGWGWAYYFDRNIVAADRVTAGTFYAYNYLKGLYVSTDGGDSWTLVHSGEIQSWSSYNAKLRSVPGFAGHLFFSVGQQGSTGDVNPSDAPLMRSTDGGVHWAGLPNVKEVYDIGFGKPSSDGGYPAVFIAGWVDSVWGIWASYDDCATWTQAGDFPMGSFDAIKTVAGDPNLVGRVYVGFAGSGYAYRDLP